MEASDFHWPTDGFCYRTFFVPIVKIFNRFIFFYKLKFVFLGLVKRVLGSACCTNEYASVEKLVNRTIISNNEYTINIHFM